MSFKIGNHTIGNNSPCFIIAELSANHNQKLEIALDTVRAAKDTGADAIKLQHYTPDTITLDSDKSYFQITQGTIWDGITLYKLYQEAYMPWEWTDKIMNLADKLDLVCFSSPFDFSAVDFLEKYNVPAYKIASVEITDIQLIEYVALKGKPIIISNGVAELEDLQLAIDTCRKAGNNNIAILKCTSGYPAPLDEINLVTIPDIAKRFNVVAGLSDHTLGISVPVASVALGAKIIEKHFILDKSMGGPDSSFSLEPKEFTQMVKSIREVEKALGTVSYELTPESKKSRQHARSLFVALDMKAGEVFTDKNLRSVRPIYGLHPKYYKEILGKKANKDLEKGTPMSFDFIS